VITVWGPDGVPIQEVNLGAGQGTLSRLDLRRPTLLVDRERVARNIQRMTKRAEAFGVLFRPHFKTHRSLEIGRWFKDFGVGGITVSSVQMAGYFASDGWNDITIAFPVNLRELPSILELAERVTLGVLVDSARSAAALAALKPGRSRAWIKVDTGYGRVGVAWDDDPTLLAVAEALRHSGVGVAGVLAHNGLTYRERTLDGVLRTHREGVARLRRVRDFLSSSGVSELAVSIGDTPGVSLGDSFDGVDEVRPGNFVFYDLTQAAIGSCSADDIAVAVACPVVSTYPRRGEVVVYGGAAHLSVEALELDVGGRIYGRVGAGWPDAADPGAPVVRLSQEHGVIDTGEGAAPDLAPGDLVCVLPVHSCLTCNLHDRYLTVDGEPLRTIRCGEG
jgi:D-serine deaminase-like pyridoxal phosphate-dependent protein